MEILKGFFKHVQSELVYLNYSRTKSIQVCLDPDLPNIVPVFKLNDHDHKCEIIFSKEIMDALAKKSDEIMCSLRQRTEKIFLLNDELKIFSERMHNQCAISFLNLQGVRINMMSDSFRTMTELSHRSKLMYTKVQEKVNESSQNLKEFLDSLLAKYNQCNVNNLEFQGFLQQLHQCASSLDQSGSNSSNDNNQIINISDISNDNDDDDDDNEINDDASEYSDEYYDFNRLDYDEYDEYY